MDKANPPKKGICENCGINPGSPYLFYAARETSEKSESTGLIVLRTTKSKKIYGLKAPHQASLCQSCVGKQSQDKIRSEIWPFAVFSPFALYMLINLPNFLLHSQTSVLNKAFSGTLEAVLAIGGLYFLAAAVVEWAKYRREEDYREKYNQVNETGERLAIKLHAAEFKKQGLECLTPRAWESMLRRYQKDKQG